EIRDVETAKIAVQASLTGHLVLSTLHTNTAIGAVTRLRDMGVEPFLLSSTLIGVMAQRLVRLLCPECKQAHPSKPNLYIHQGCQHCNDIGYRGRTGIYELFNIDNTLRTMMHDSAGQQALESYAYKQSENMQQDAMKRVVAGETTLDELLRVTNEA
ncbi:MAG: Flp pilus assembly complex ATPase component TadA, partial [Thiotrichaceae bacterium]|nr:Flp pilus assembly complex ATPase component TadA [Thiotrichaceae bacterium]